MPERMIVVDANSILRLLTHYSDGAAVPLDAELRTVAFHPKLNRYILLQFETEEEGPAVQQVRYEGKKILVWGGERDAPPIWEDAGDRRPGGA